MTETANVFISYAREDGTEHSIRLRDELTKSKITCWRDERIDPTVDFTREIEEALEAATHVAVIVTPDLKRADSFVRLEIGYALTHKKRIIPLVFSGGHRPITIINHTYINFAEWDTGFSGLLERLKDFGATKIDPETQQEREIAYIQEMGERYDHWRDLYTDLAATARIEERKVKLKSSAARFIQMRHKMHPKIDHSVDAEKGMTVTAESFDELREGIRKYKRVALIGDPGAGKTTTLERLAYELASEVVDDEGNFLADKPLPLFVRLGAYDGSDFLLFMESFFGGLSLSDYLPQCVVLLLDGLNEMPPEYHDKVNKWLIINTEALAIVSCRKLDYVELKLPLQRIDVAPLDLERIRLFIGNFLEDEDRETLFWALAGHDARRAWAWYKNKKSSASYREFLHGEDGPGEDYIPERKVLDSLRQQFQEQNTLPDMLGVVTNPFLMQIVIEIYALEGEPPANKGDLFGRFVDLLLEERGKTAQRQDRLWISESKQKQALAVLAYRMQLVQTGTSISLEFVKETFVKAMPDEDPDLLLFFAISASILEQSSTIRFSHQLLQEYFAAYEMGEDMRRGVPASKYFPSDEWWLPTGWEESALLLAGMEKNATKIVEWLTPVQPDLAYKVAKESGAKCDEKALGKLYRPAENARRSPYALAEWGRNIADNDTRSGVGLRADGLPDIAWGKAVTTDRYIYQNRQHTLGYSYKLAKYPVIMTQFQAFLDDKEMGFNHDDWWQDFPDNYKKQEMAEQRNKYANHPRDSISWYQSVAFCSWLTVKYREAKLLENDWEIRLPTEQEWEVAARYPDGRKYSWGDDFKAGHANCDEQENSDGPYFLNQSTAVGLYESGRNTSLELYDMNGNVWEWCLSKYEDGSNEIDESGESRVLRGGSFFGLTHYARSASRSSYSPVIRLSYGGFRVCVGSVW